jgi:hypothetical protein
MIVDDSATVAYIAVYPNNRNVSRGVYAPSAEALREGEGHHASVAASVHNSSTACST